jgi:plastocyanin
MLSRCLETEILFGTAVAVDARLSPNPVRPMTPETSDPENKRTGGRGRALAVAVLLLLVAAPRGTAQSVLDRPPNFQGTWVGETGTVYFNFLHRFIATDPPVRKVINYPTFLLGVGLPLDLLLGANYTTNSTLVPQVPNEWEYYARFAPLLETRGAPVSLALQAGYNNAARSWDGQVTVGRAFGPVRLMGSGRAFSNAFDDGEARYAWAGGATVRLARYVALAGDYGDLIDRPDGEGEPVWSAGVQLQIPFTPHTLSLHATNALTTTLEGASVGTDETRYGFEFTIPLTLSRYFGSDSEQNARQAAPVPGSGIAAEVGMTNRLTFTPDTVRIRVGETVRWTNGSALLHTVTLDPSKATNAASVSMPAGASTFDSGNIEPGATFDHTFTVPGEYKYVCIPHEAAAMVGWVIVEGGDGA